MGLESGFTSPIYSPEKSGSNLHNIPVLSAIPDENIDEIKTLAHQGQGSFLSAGANLLKTFIGAGIISLPFAIYEFGYLTGVVLMTVAAVASCLGLYFSLRVATLFGRESNPFLAAQITIPSLGYVLDGAISLKSLGVSLSYLLLIGDIMSSFVRGILENCGTASEFQDLTEPRIWITCFMILIIPLSFLRRMDHLKYSSMLGLVSVAYLLVLAGVTFFMELPNIDFTYSNPFQDWTFTKLSRFGIFMLAFTCHQNIFPIHNETKNNSVKSMSKLCIVCISLAYFMYIWYGLFSYFAFSEIFFLNSGLGGSIFKYYSGTEIPFQVARILFAFLLAFSFPLQVFPFRLSYSRLLMCLPFMRNRTFNPYYMFIALSSAFIVVTFCIAMLQPDISNVLSLIGGVTSTVVCYILPSVIFLKLTMKRPKFFARENISTARVAAMVLFIFGICVFAICTTASIANFFK